MSVATRLEQLQPRERRLLNVLVMVFAVLVVIVVPLGLRVALLGGAERNRRLAEAIQAIHDQRATLARRQENAESIASRYARPAPPLAEFLETLTKQQQLEIPESQDRPAMPHGKQFEERSNRIVLRRVGLLPLAKFLEGIAQSGHPVAVTEFDIKKRAPDAYDVTMVVSAYDMKTKEKSAAKPDGAESDATKPESTDEVPTPEPEEPSP